MNRPDPAPTPLYQQVKDHILGEIAGGSLRPDTPVPSENQLVKALGVSRMTVNRALRELADEGVLRRVQGVGTFVAPARPQVILLDLPDPFDEAAARRGNLACDVRLLREEEASDKVAERLDLFRGAPVFHSVIVYSDGERPSWVDNRYISPSLVPGYLGQDFSAQSPARYLEEVAATVAAEHQVEALAAPSPLQRLLRLEGPDPCLMLTRRQWAHAGISCVVEVTRPAGRSRMSGRRSPGRM